MIFTEFGWPFVQKSDNGPCYTSREFHNFLEFYKSTPYHEQPAHHPQSNGFTEALVGILKKLMEKSSVKDGKPWNYGLLQYRMTPNSQVTFHHHLEALTGMKTENLSLPQIPSSVGNICGNIPGSVKELMKRSAKYFHPFIQWNSNQDSLFS